MATRGVGRVDATAHQCGRSCVARQNNVGHRRWRDGRRVGRPAGTGSRTIPKWSNRFLKTAATRCRMSLVRPRVVGDAQIDTLINATLKSTPPCHALVTRSNAMHLGLSQSGKTAWTPVPRIDPGRLFRSPRRCEQGPLWSTRRRHPSPHRPSPHRRAHPSLHYSLCRRNSWPWN